MCVYIYIYYFSSVYIYILCTIVYNTTRWQQPKCPPIGAQLDKLCISIQ